MDKSEEENYFDYNVKEKILQQHVNCVKDIISPLIHIVTRYDTNLTNIIELEKTAKSLINQTFINWKWTIIKQEAISLEKLKYEDSRIEFISTKESLIKMQNEIIANSECEIIFILRIGNILDKTLLECGYWSLQTNKEASWCYSNYVLDDKTKVEKNFSSFEEKKKNIVSSSYFIRKDKFFKIGGLQNNLETDIEWLMWLKLLSKDEYPIKMNYYGSWENRRNISSKESLTEINNQIINIRHDIIGINYPVGTVYWYDTFPHVIDNTYETFRNEKIHLLFILPWFKVGGADKFNYDLISNLDKNKYNITIITTEPSPYVWRQKFEEIAEIFDLTTFLHRENWAAFIYYIIKSRNVKIVMNSNSFYGYYAIPWLKYKFPEVIFTDYLHAVNWNWRNGEYPKDSTAISKLIDKTYVSSEKIKQTMKNEMGRKEENVEVVYIGVDSEKFDEEKIKLDDYPNIQKEMAKYKDKKKILFCARISPEKRPLFMIKVLEYLIKEDENVVLFVVGTGQEITQMKEQAKIKNIDENIVFFGEQKDVRPFYKISDVLIICSVREGITLTSYEALSMKLPVISADVGGQKELITNECGIIVNKSKNLKEDRTIYDEEEIKTYVEAIKKIIYNKNYNILQKDCRERIQKKFTIKHMIEKIEKSFEELLKNGSKIPKELLDNEELYGQYLLMYNEIDKRMYNSTVGGIIPKQNTKSSDEVEKLQKQIKEYQVELNKKDKLIQKQEQDKEKINKELYNIYNSKRWKYINYIADKLGRNK